MARVKEFPRKESCPVCEEGAIVEQWTCGCRLIKACECKKDENGIVVFFCCGQKGHPKDHEEKIGFI